MFADKKLEGVTTARISKGRLIVPKATGVVPGEKLLLIQIGDEKFLYSAAKFEAVIKGIDEKIQRGETPNGKSPDYYRKLRWHLCASVLTYEIPDKDGRINISPFNCNNGEVKLVGDGTKLIIK